ncbi:hypothetical protein N7462_001145, partial [Penicillium macrosclerotiorum]|uniref:uncharacterized protein n=1 Tax=Penicillium macrosclerotiorum TaxID=303699 RepID=UPI0025482325
MCDGNAPCKACKAKSRECQRTGTDMRGKWRSIEKPHTRSQDLTSRLNQVESQLAMARGMKSRCNEVHEQIDRRTHQVDTPKVLHDIRSGHNRTPSPRVPTFSGETSIAHNLTIVEGRLEQMGVQYTTRLSKSPNMAFASRLTPSPETALNHFSEWQPSFIQKILDAHGIVADRQQWDELMHTFCDEVHVLVPFLHLPSLWNLYEDTWRTSFNHGTNDLNRSNISRVRVAHVLLSIANGKCVESSCFEADHGSYSAGWSLYCAAREIFGDLLNAFRQCTDQLLVLQTVVLMVVYLFRLDAHGSAEKVLALSISHAHHLGLQREKVIKRMTPFDGEMSRRLWWCIYLLDRRLAIETGRPFLIQDVNVDVGLPHNVSDERLTRHQLEPHGPEVEEDIGESNMTKVPYLVAMTSYSRVIGKVWEALYGAVTSESTPSPLINEYLEHLARQSQKGLEKEFMCDPYKPEEYKTEGLAWWQVKQHLMMRIRWSSLYLLIRKPILQRVRLCDSEEPEIIANEVICIRLAHRIIDDFSKVPEEHPKYTFPFLHYLTSATIISLGLIIKQPSFRGTYGTLTLKAARSLRKHCRKTWMSGKMIETVWALNQMADAVLTQPERASYNFECPTKSATPPTFSNKSSRSASNYFEYSPQNFLSRTGTGMRTLGISASSFLGGVDPGIESHNTNHSTPMTRRFEGFPYAQSPGWTALNP